MEDDPLDEFDSCLDCLSWYWHHLNPLGEVVYSNEQILMSSDYLRNLADDVQP